jgi:hypothetical protein
MSHLRSIDLTLCVGRCARSGRARTERYGNGLVAQAVTFHEHRTSVRGKSSFADCSPSSPSRPRGIPVGQTRGPSENSRRRWIPASARMTKKETISSTSSPSRPRGIPVGQTRGSIRKVTEKMGPRIREDDRERDDRRRFGSSLDEVRRRYVFATELQMQSQIAVGMNG